MWKSCRATRSHCCRNCCGAKRKRNNSSSRAQSRDPEAVTFKVSWRAIACDDEKFARERGARITVLHLTSSGAWAESRGADESVACRDLTVDCDIVLSRNSHFA